MAKRPTPKQHQAKSRSGNRYASYLRGQWRWLRNQMNSPYSAYVRPKGTSEEKAMEKITKIKA